MWKIILFFCVLVLSLFGLTELLHKAWMMILKPKTMAKRFLVVLLNDDNAQQQLNYTQEYLRWSGDECATELIAINCGVKDKLLASCNGKCSICGKTKVYNYNEILDLVKRENVFNDTSSAEQL